MRFENVEQLLKFVFENGEVNKFDFSITPITEEVEEPKADDQCNVTTNQPVLESVILGDFIVPLKLPAEYGNKNAIFVEAYNAIDNTCGACTVQINGSHYNMNACTVDGVSTVSFPVDFGDGIKYDTPLTIIVSEDKKSKVMIKGKEIE